MSVVKRSQGILCILLPRLEAIVSLPLKRMLALILNGWNNNRNLDFGSFIQTLNVLTIYSQALCRKLNKHCQLNMKSTLCTDKINVTQLN